MIYLDYNASAPMKPAVRAAILESMERHGNPSSVHRYGRIARRYIEEARAHIAALLGVGSPQIIFTSGGTEANNMVFASASFPKVLTSAIEHDSVLLPTQGADRLAVNQAGVLDLAAAELKFQEQPKGSLISVMFANNETGVIQPVAEIVRLAKKYGHFVHADAVQAVGRLPIDFTALGLDYLTLSSHKIGGPQGVGALIVANDIVLKAMLKGGGQELNRRAGSENVAGLVGFGVAACLAVDDLRDMPRLAKLRNNLQERLTSEAADDAVILGAEAPRVANTLCVAMRGLKSETQVMAMDLAGIAVSAGSACSSGKVKASQVLRAMGYADDVAGSALRISFGWDTEEKDIYQCAEAWCAVYRRYQQNQHLIAA